MIRPLSDRNKGVQCTDANALAGEGVILAHIAAEDLHRSNTQTQGEEGLVHGGGDYAAPAVFFYGVQIGYQIEFQTLGGAGERQGVDGQHHDQYQQCTHHVLADFLKAILKPLAANKEACNDGDYHKDCHFRRIRQHGAKYTLGRGRVHAAVEGAGGKLYKVVQHPAGNGGIVHHQQIAAENCEPTVDMPFGLGLFQRPIGKHCALAAGTANGQLHGQDRKTHEYQKNQIQQHKQTAAILPDHIGETPDITDANGASGRYQQEPQPGLERFSFHV